MASASAGFDTLSNAESWDSWEMVERVNPFDDPPPPEGRAGSPMSSDTISPPPSPKKENPPPTAAEPKRRRRFGFKLPQRKPKAEKKEVESRPEYDNPDPTKKEKKKKKKWAAIATGGVTVRADELTH